ncbi:hypothetical protein ZIOFF_024298 [Zingiber officinale]|uniref:Morc S5 domain-containing protein n=1 Tax=Zingiber officinale TaxID=94328 RepID=A0A8J5LDG4_ZINOF|nr:hypothetical protein ZIOFF_024298 [Zingiber officinale]
MRGVLWWLKARWTLKRGGLEDMWIKLKEVGAFGVLEAWHKDILKMKGINKPQDLSRLPSALQLLTSGSQVSAGLGLEFHVAKCFGAPLQVVAKVHFPSDDLLLADYYRGLEVQRLLSTSLLHSKWSDFPLFISGGYILLVYAHLMSVATAVLRMNYTNFIDLSCDEESEQTYFEDVKPIFPLQISSGKSGCSTVNDQSLHRGVSLKQELEESRSSTSGSSIIDQGGPSANMISLNFASPSSPVPLCRQFWKSGDYEVGQAISSTSENGRNRLRIHPKFLHSNATSHKWAFGAIAELLDNAVDEAQNGATLVTVEKFINSRDGSHALLIQDDGGGMDPESLRRCISFGFSDKQSGLSIGQYGNGFKTSTMRLGADDQDREEAYPDSKRERLIGHQRGMLLLPGVEKNRRRVVNLFLLVGVVYERNAEVNDEYRTRLLNELEKGIDSSPDIMLDVSIFNLKLQHEITDSFSHGGELTQALDGRNRLRIHPKFLHSNATSHKWAFGAIAELLDNAVDEAQNGATLVTVEKFINSRDGSHALLIQDDGGGMDPKSLRRCISFGFSDKQSGLSIGQYGNGFKTSTMRLGADVIIFSRSKKERQTVILFWKKLSWLPPAFLLFLHLAATSARKNSLFKPLVLRSKQLLVLSVLNSPSGEPSGSCLHSNVIFIYYFTVATWMDQDREEAYPDSKRERLIGHQRGMLLLPGVEKNRRRVVNLFLLVGVVYERNAEVNDEYRTRLLNELEKGIDSSPDIMAFTQSIGLLSYTFLRETGCDDIIVPTDSSPFSTKNASLIGIHNFMQADYEFDELTNSFKRLYRHDEKHFSSNLSTILEWSPFNTEDKLLAQFIDIGHHGTKIIIFNLWLNDDGNMELDFQLDAKDIMISEAQRQVQKHKHDSKQIANRLRFSLRAYISILYLRIPQNFRIVLRGEVVKPHNIANDLIYRECILYKPQACGVSEASIVTTIGFLDGAPNVNVHGFNVYHKNRLILCSLHLHMLPQLHMKYCVAFKYASPPLHISAYTYNFPYWKVANNSYGKGRGVVGVLETNFIKPTHDKQDFEKSALYQKLESRLKEMTYEYWDLHCHLVGYYNNKKPAAPRPSTVVCQMPQLGTSSSLDLVETKDFTPAKLERTTLITASTQPISCITPTDLKCDGSIQTRLPLKRKNENQVAATRETKVQNLSNPFGSRSTKATKDSGSGVQPIPDIKAMILKNKELRDQCLEYEETEKQLVQKAKKLRAELLEVLEAYKKLLIDVIPIEDVKTETL